MKKLIAILAIVAIATPVMASVTISAVKSGTADFDITYSNTDANKVRAFALDISIAGGATVSSVTCSNSSYYIYPGSIQISGGSVQSYGSCICAAGTGGALGGVGTSGVTIEMGSLYPETNHPAPASSGILARVTFSSCSGAVTLAANAARGNAVKENPAEATTVVLNNGVCSSDCFPSTYTATYAGWVAMGKPDCWCGTNTTGMTTVPVRAWPAQCSGDADNTTAATYRIYTNDYNILWSNYKRKTTTPGLNPCADFDHTTAATYRIYTGDYNILWSNYKKKNSQLPMNCPQGK